MANFIHLTEASSGAPRNSGTNADLCTLLDWALVSGAVNAGWAINQTATNARVYKPPAGNRFCLYVNHDSAVSGAAQLATVRGCESATAASEAGIVNPFPTIAEVAATSATWIISSAASTTTRNFDIFASDRFVYYITNVSGASNVYQVHMFGDFSPTLTGDVYNTLCSTRNASSTSASADLMCNAGSIVGTTRLWVCRSYDGTVKSVSGSIFTSGGSSMGAVTACAAALAGATGLIDRVKCQIMDTGATTTTFSTTKGIASRGWIPNLWLPVHSGFGTVNARDTFTDTAYNGSATFEAFMNSGNSTFFALETTNTWSPPSG